MEDIVLAISNFIEGVENKFPELFYLIISFEKILFG